MSARSLPFTRLTLPDWCAASERVAYVQTLFADPMFRELVAMLSNVRPVLPKTPLDATTAAVLLGQRIGHDQVIASLLTAGTSPPAPPADIAADYAAENVMAAWEGEKEQA